VARLLLSALGMRRHALGIGVIGAALALVVGCGSTVVEQSPGSGGSGAGGGGSSTTSTSTGTSTTTGAGGAGGACGGYEDQPGSATVTIHIVNETDQPIYLPSSCSTVQLSIDRAGGSDDGVTYAYDPSCLQTCEDLQTEPQYACGACAPISYLLPPGGSRDVVWKGTGLKYDVKMPDACWESPGFGSCSRVVTAPSGQYTVHLTGYATCDGPCECDGNGVCNGVPTGATAYTDLSSFIVPSANEVDVVFGTCAFGCPD
jgi:hypothetical protein